MDFYQAQNKYRQKQFRSILNYFFKLLMIIIAIFIGWWLGNRDKLVLIQENEHPFLKREGNNLHYDLYISISDAVLGVSKEIETVTGNVRIKLESGIQSGKILRLRGKGLSSINSYGSGDLLVHINVWTPKTLNKEQKNFFEHMKNDDNFTPSPEKGDKSFFEKVKDMFS